MLTNKGEAAVTAEEEVLEDLWKVLRIAERAAEAMGVHEGASVPPASNRKDEVQTFLEAVASGRFRTARDRVRSLAKAEEIVQE
jgi:hypothetical protein